LHEQRFFVGYRERGNHILNPKQIAQGINATSKRSIRQIGVGLGHRIGHNKGGRRQAAR
jgi:hypothetical protein